MTNLWTGTVDTHGEYQDLATLSSLTFSSGTKYLIQIVGKGYLREGTEGEGFFIENSTPVEYVAGNEDLYIRTHYPSCKVNIAS